MQILGILSDFNQSYSTNQISKYNTLNEMPVLTVTLFKWYKSAEFKNINYEKVAFYK